MTGTAYPGDAVAGVPTYSATQGRTALAGGQGGATAARPLGGFSGIRYQPGVGSIVSVTSTTWTVTPFNGYIDLESPGTTGGYYFSFQANETGTVTAAAGSARVDLLYVQVSDSNTGDGSGLSPRVVVGYQAGTAGAGVPTLSAPRAFVIAWINVPASGGGAPTTQLVAPFTVAAGGILPCINSGYYPPAASYSGFYIDDLSTGSLLRSNGSSWLTVGSSPWVSYTPTIANITLGSSTVTGRYMILSGYCTVEIDVTMGAGSAMGTAPTFSAPVPFGSGYLADAPLGHESTALVAGTTYFVAVLRSASSTNLVTFYQKNVAGTYESLTSTSAGIPATWGTTGVMQLRFGFRV